MQPLMTTYQLAAKAAVHPKVVARLLRKVRGGKLTAPPGMRMVGDDAVFEPAMADAAVQWINDRRREFRGNKPTNPAPALTA